MSRTAPPRRITAEEAAGLVRSGDWVDYGFGIGRPDVFDRALAARRQCDFIHRNPMA
jgi:acyl-CoA hydrolase